MGRFKLKKMILKSKVEVTYNQAITGTATGIIQGAIESIAWDNDFQNVGVNFVYYDVNGTPLFRNAFFVNGDAIDQFYDSIKANIPTGLGKRDTERWTFYLAFQFQMAQTFGIEVTDIDIVE